MKWVHVLIKTGEAWHGIVGLAVHRPSLASSMLRFSKVINNLV